MTEEASSRWAVIFSERLALVTMPPQFIDAILRDDRAAASAFVAFRLMDGWPDQRARRTLAYRQAQLQTDPTALPWLLRAMVLPDGSMVGYINFHGPPEDGSVELGYTVLPAYRRRGFATEAIRALMGWAEREHGVHRFRLSIAPANEPSLSLARKLGFREIGAQMDAEDGLELVFELIV